MNSVFLTRATRQVQLGYHLCQTYASRATRPGRLGPRDVHASRAIRQARLVARSHYRRGRASRATRQVRLVGCGQCRVSRATHLETGDPVWMSAKSTANALDENALNVLTFPRGTAPQAGRRTAARAAMDATPVKRIVLKFWWFRASLIRSDYCVIVLLFRYIDFCGDTLYPYSTYNMTSFLHLNKPPHLTCLELEGSSQPCVTSFPFIIVQ
jgi:hypothetical protein